MTMTTLTNVEIKKVRPTKHNPTAKGYEVEFDCAGGCGKRQSRYSNATMTRDAALLEVLGRVLDNRMCYDCAEKAKTVEERIADRVEGAQRDIAYRRKIVVENLEQAVKSANDELKRMTDNPFYISGVRGFTNWVRHHAEKIDETAKEIEKRLAEIDVLKSLLPKPSSQPEPAQAETVAS